MIRRAFLRLKDLRVEEENKNAGWPSGEKLVVYLTEQWCVAYLSLHSWVIKGRFSAYNEMPNVRTPKLFS